LSKFSIWLLFIPAILCGEKEGFRSLFDGKSLAGWEGKPDFFRVEDSCIVAGHLVRRIPQNEFLVTEQSWENCEFIFEARLLGPGSNAGVQFWSQRLPGSNEMIGYQCDIGAFKKGLLWGWLYDESRRNHFLASASQSDMQEWAHPKGEWNKLRVKAYTPRIQIWLNEHLISGFEEMDASISQSGHIGLQIHSGPPLECWFREIKIRKL